MAPISMIGVLLAALAQSPAASTPPQAPGPASPPVADSLSQPRKTFRSAVELVTLSVTVTDGKDKQVTGLSREDFQVLEEGKPQEIAFFAAAEVPLDVILLMDTSSSMSGKMPVAQEAARRFVRALHPRDRAAVVEFNSQVRIIQPFTSDREQVLNAVGATRARGGTALYMGLYIALDHFSRLARNNADIRKSAIVVLSDGEDTTSLLGEEEVVHRARRAGVPVYFISLLSELESRQLSDTGERRQSQPHDFILRTLSRETGGRAFFPVRVEDLKDVYDSVARELATQYTLAYSSSGGAADGSFRRVLVRVLSRPDARPRTRAGYYAPGPPNAMR